MANLFGKNKLKDAASKIDIHLLEQELDIVRTWHEDYHNGTLKRDKETSREQAYNQDFFIKILGYAEKPNALYSFEPKATTEKGQLPDAVIGYNDTTNNISNIKAVVELKGASIDLDRPQRREGNMSPVQQGFKYKIQYRNCPFVLISNFWELRLYHDNQLDYEAWTLDDLVDPADDYFKFRTFYTLLHASRLISAKGSSKTEDLLSDIRFKQEEISKKFYKVYRQVRLELLRDIYSQNSEVRNNIDLGIEKAQKIIDRVVFACFAEDIGLLPDDIIQRVVKAADNSVFGGSLWSTFKAFFEAIDVGSAKLEIPDGYNGGLFAYDKALNDLKVSDNVLRSVVNLSKYNYNEDLSVTILGHIFEQSINDLEEIKSLASEENDLANLQLSRRKKDGIYYTPDYVVRYIVDNSLGAYLSEYEEKFKSEFALKGDINDKNYEKRERQAYSKYQDFLHNVKVLDPACGSGAFLVYVFDLLLAENKRVASILGNNLFSSEDYIKSILQNNIYGVDLNDESVEITKLSLWLKTAQKGKKLTTLDNNIKCGNSLIEDEKIAGSKAFNWQSAFPDIFKNGGFNVIVGNPPYVATKQIAKDEREYFWNRYDDILFSEMDLYEIFTYKMISQILKADGYLGFITPDSYFTNTSFQHYRKYLLTNTQVNSVVDFPYRFFPFPDVNTETAIITLKKTKAGSNVTNLWSIDKKETSATKLINQYTLKSQSQVKQSDVSALFEGKIIINQDPVMTKMLTIKGRFGDHLELHKGWMSVPATTPYKGDIIESGTFTKAEVNNLGIESIVKKYLEGRDIHRYYFDYVEKFVNVLGIDNKTANWHYSPKIILQRIVGQNKNKIFATYDDNNYVIFPNANLINSKNDESPKIYLPVLNSTLISYFYNAYFGESNTNLTKSALEGIPLPELSTAAKDWLAKKADVLLEGYSNLNKASNHFTQLVLSETKQEKWPTKLNSWWRLDFTVVSHTLKLTLQQKDEVLPIFNKYKRLCSEVDTSILHNEREVDDFVCDLYGVSLPTSLNDSLL